ncbi:MAG TPA: helix-turn-helix domain-containing protein, partial [Candidatus Sulfotelmatobacter sp.]|nr:helix-turn-helix domain-containing protein [Candidatus Sulfotelmatobacter sp.]
MQSLAARHGVAPRGFAADAAERLRAHGWPGNVRELRNVVESLLLMDPGGAITVAELAPLLALPVAVAPAPPATLEDAERTAIAHALRRAQGNVAGAARLLGISRSTLYRKVEHYRLPV